MDTNKEMTIEKLIEYFKMDVEKAQKYLIDQYEAINAQYWGLFDDVCRMEAAIKLVQKELVQKQSILDDLNAKMQKVKEERELLFDILQPGQEP
jgi:hypothetical protein